MTVEDYFTDELIYSERMCVADRKEIPSMASSNVNDSDTELLGRVLAGKKKKLKLKKFIFEWKTTAGTSRHFLREISK